MKYCLIQENKIVKYNVDKPKVITSANKGIYLPLEDNRPTLGKYSKIAGSKYEIQEDKVIKIYTTYTMSDEEIVKFEIASKTKQAEQAIDKLIADEIKKYNEANGILFKDIDSIAKYTMVEDYSHKEFCIAIVNWVAKVWDKARDILTEVKNGDRDMPTIEEFIEELPKLEGE